MSTIWLLRIGLFQNRIQVTGPSCRKGRFEDKVEFREALLRQIKVFFCEIVKETFSFEEPQLTAGIKVADGQLSQLYL